MHESRPSTLSAIRRFITRWRKVGIGAAALVLCEIGARTILPGVNTDVLRDFLQTRSGDWLRGLYDILAGGALSRGAILALGVLPYLSARSMMRLARVSIPPVQRAWERDDSARLIRWTRVLTGSLALIQSYGFALFVQKVPGVVDFPGPGFTARTIVTLTGGALAVMWLSEQFGRASADAPDEDSAVTPALAPASPPPLLDAAQPPIPNARAQREPTRSVHLK